MTDHCRPTAAAFCAALIAVALGASAAVAGETGRTLAGHTFLSSNAMTDPFITTYVRSSTGFGVATDVLTVAEGPYGDEVTLEGDVVYLMLDFEYQYAFTDWLAVRASASGYGRTGIDEETAVSPGLSGGGTTGIGATFRVWTAETAQISITLDGAMSSLTALTPLDFLKEVLEDGFDGDNSLVEGFEVWNTRAGLSGAWAPSEWVGFMAFWAQGVGEAHDTDTELEYSVGGLASLDLGKLTRVPVGILLSGKTDSFVYYGADLAEGVVDARVGVFYTGRPGLQVGLEGSKNWLPRLGDDETIDAFTTALVMKYTF